MLNRGQGPFRDRRAGNANLTLHRDERSC